MWQSIDALLGVNFRANKDVGALIVGVKLVPTIILISGCVAFVKS
jgi:hypothetical protein